MSITKDSLSKNEGKTIHNRDFEYLKQYLYIIPKNRDQVKENKETFELAENILVIRKSEHLQGKYNFKDENKEKQSFLNYYMSLKEDRFDSKANYDNWDSAGKHIRQFFSLDFLQKLSQLLKFRFLILLKLIYSYP